MNLNKFRETEQYKTLFESDAFISDNVSTLIFFSDDITVYKKYDNMFYYENKDFHNLADYKFVVIVTQDLKEDITTATKETAKVVISRILRQIVNKKADNEFTNDAISEKLDDLIDICINYE